MAISNIVKATIQMRQGLEKDFDPDQMTVGEWAVSTDAKYVRMCFAPGVCLRMATYESFEEDMKEIQTILATCQDIQLAVDAMADLAEQHKNAAALSAEAAKVSETNAKKSETASAESASTASSKATDALNSSIAANTSAVNAKESETITTQKASDASTYASNAKASANTANTHATTASTKASESAESANTATVKANSASASASLAESYAVGGTGTRENEDVDNAKYYKEQAERISQGLSGALIPMGTITFVDLQNQSKQPGYMYNISDSFTTDSTFKEGAGHEYAAGTNVYYTADGYWDCIAGTNVVGVKGAKETTYRQGNVNITPENIGALPEDGNALTATKAEQDGNGNNIVETYQTKTGDTANNVVSFSSGDSTNPTGWADINIVTSGETHASLFRKFSLAVKNLRYLYKMLGSTDISSIGDGTITGAISTQNSNLNTVKRGVSLGSNVDLNNVLYSAYSSYSTYVKQLVNAPSECSTGGEVAVRWIPTSSYDDYGVQILIHVLGTTVTIYKRVRKDREFSDWKT